MVIDKMEKI